MIGHPIILSSIGPTVICYPGMVEPKYPAVHAYSADSPGACLCGEIQLQPGTIGLPLVYTGTLSCPEPDRTSPGVQTSRRSSAGFDSQSRGSL